MSVITVFKDAWSNRNKLGESKKSRQLAAFLPPALEIQEAPPNPLAKWLGRSLVVLFSIGIFWACVGKVNIVASAEGKIIPSSRVKQIQPLEKGVVKKIHVAEGQRVAKGQPLIELDSTLTGADKTRLAGELQSVQFRRSISQTFLGMLGQQDRQYDNQGLSAVVLLGAPLASVQDDLLHKRLLWQQWQHYLAQLKSLQSSVQKSNAEQAATREIIKKLEQTLPIVTKRRDAIKALESMRFAPESDLLELEQEHIQQTQDLAAEKQRYKQFLAAEQEIEQQINILKAQTRREQLTEIMEAQRQIAALQEELTKASDLNAKQILYSPVAGQVQELAIATVGGVVTEAQQLMLIVPEGEKLEVEVFLGNKDIGFVEEGMASEIKIHTFPFTKYGVIEGRVLNISNDAIVDEKLGLIYSMRVLMNKSTLMVNGKEVTLMPGMAVTAELQTGKRRIIEFFLAPLLRHKAESMRER